MRKFAIALTVIACCVTVVAQEPAPVETVAADPAPQTTLETLEGEEPPAPEPMEGEQTPAAPAPQEGQPEQAPIVTEPLPAPVAPPAEQQPPVEAAPPAEEPPAAEQAAAPAATEPQPAAPAQAQPQGEQKPEEKKKEEKKFVKGEISNIGARDIVYPYNSLGVGTGITFIGQDLFLTLDPRFVYNKNDFNMLMAFHLPINIRMFSTDLNRAADENFTLREEDWDEWQDYFRIIKYIQYGRSEDTFYTAIGSNIAQSLGHGTIMKRYVPNFDPNFTKISFKLNYYNDYVGFETVLGDVTDGNMFGALFFVKPLSWLAKDESDYMARSFSIGFTFAGDRKAPTMIDYVDYVFSTPGGGTVVMDGNDPAWPAGLNRRIEVDDKGRPIVMDDEFVYLMGLDTEFKFFKNGYVDLKTYVDYSWMKTDPARGGFTWGLLGRFNLDKEREHIMRTRIEARAYNGRYLPSFFDTFYDIERYEMMTNIAGVSDFAPNGYSKYHMLSLQPDKFFFSLYAELTYTYVDWITISLGMEQLRKSTSVYAHIEFPDLWIFKGMLSYYQRGILKPEDFVENFDYSAMFRGVVRIELLPILFLNAYIGKQWAFWPENKPRQDELQGHYLSSWDLGADIEIGWEWGGDDEEEEAKKKEEEEAKKAEEEKKE